MTDPGPRLAQLLLAGYEKLVAAAMRELAARGYDDVRPSLHYALLAISEGAASASDLGRATSVTKQAAAKTIATLTARGWVTREDDAGDRRRKRLVVTDLGHRVMEEGAAIFDELREEWAREIGPEALAGLEKQVAEFVSEGAASA